MSENGDFIPDGWVHIADVECPKCYMAFLHAESVNEQGSPCGEMRCMNCGAVFSEVVDIQEVHQCTNVDGEVRCTSTETMPCFLEVESDPAEADDWLCDEHIRHSGYCMGCGQFWGGIESFDFGNGFCEHCNAEFSNDYDEDDWDYDDYPDEAFMEIEDDGE